MAGRGSARHYSALAVEREHPRRVALALFCVCLVTYGYFVYRGGHHNPDSRLALTYAVVERRVLDIDPDAPRTLDRAYVGGHYYTDKAPGLSLLLVPLYAGLRLTLPDLLRPEPSPPGRAPPDVAPLTPVSPDRASLDSAPLAAAALAPASPRTNAVAPDRFVARYLLTFFGLGVPAALFAAFLYSWLVRVEANVGPRLAVVAGYALGSPAYPFAVSAYGHLPAGMCLFGAFALLHDTRGTWRTVAAGCLLGLAISIEYPAAVVALPVAWYGLWTTARGGRLTRAAGLFSGALPPLVALGAYHWVVFGLPWSVGYSHLDPTSIYAAGQSRGLWGIGWPEPGTGLALLGGLRRGLVVYAPWALLAVPGTVLLWREGQQGRPGRGRRAVALTALCAFAALLAVNSGYVFWDGGASWGPRHLVPTLPFLALLALPAAARWPRVAWVLVGGSILLTAAGVATRTLPEADVAVPLRDQLLPRVLAGEVTNNWGQVLGLMAWRGVVPLLVAVLVPVAWAIGWGRASGWLVTSLWALLALALLHRSYLEYSEGYYLYLGTRVAAGARLYAETASTQPPLLPLLFAALWRLSPDVYLPRLFAVGLYLLTALLAGRLATQLLPHPWVGPVATLLAGLLPLGAGTAQVLEANNVLAPLGVALALMMGSLLRPPGIAGSWLIPLAAGIVGAIGLSVKLTFLGFALAPAVALVAGLARRQRDNAGVKRVLVYLVVLGAFGGGHLALWLALSGSAALDGMVGELESPWLTAGAVLAAVQLVQLEGPVLALAAWAWWRSRQRAVVWWCGLVAGVMPLLAVHQGTFVGVARPAEPFFAAYGAVALVTLAERLARFGQSFGVTSPAPSQAARPAPWWRRLTLPALVGLAVALPLWHDLRSLSTRRVVDPDGVIIRLSAVPNGDVVAPPYYAALAGRRMPFDYADWTVWGMRAASGVVREEALAREFVAALAAGEIPLVAGDFRLPYIPGVAPALQARYVKAGDDGDAPDRSVAFFVPQGAP